MDLAHSPIAPQRPSFWIRLNQLEYPLTMIEDASPTHLDVLVPVRLNPQTTTNLIFREDHFLLKLKLKVITCVHDTKLKAWRIRFGFYTEYTEQNTLCFLALRKYLNRFDGQTLCDIDA